jgi:hypothetical protein
VCDGER